MLLLLRNSIATPDNLEALLRLIDADIRTGKVRCTAFVFLQRISTLLSLQGRRG
jgi:hypothetical protein